MNEVTLATRVTFGLHRFVQPVAPWQLAVVRILELLVDNRSGRGTLLRMDNISVALKMAILRDGRTQPAIADAAGIDKGQLSRFMRDQRTLTLSTADALCRGLGVKCRLTKPRKAR
ncbi:MAG: helix-turn-helix transcriptional regulator [Phycisphaerae bacterium]